MLIKVSLRIKMDYKIYSTVRPVVDCTATLSSFSRISSESSSEVVNPKPGSMFHPFTPFTDLVWDGGWGQIYSVQNHLSIHQRSRSKGPPSKDESRKGVHWVSLT